jgi:hypothetical protein
MEARKRPGLLLELVAPGPRTLRCPYLDSLAPMRISSLHRCGGEASKGRGEGQVKIPLDKRGRVLLHIGVSAEMATKRGHPQSIRHCKRRGTHASKEKGSKEKEVTTENPLVSSFPGPLPQAGLVFFSDNFRKHGHGPPHSHAELRRRASGNLLTLGIHFPKQSPKLF